MVMILFVCRLLAKTLASMMFDSTKESFLRLDMSEYKEEHSVAKLLGAPPGYVGFERAGTLTEHLRRRPFSLVLFDELEKASPRVSDILLQLFDDGRLTDSHGRTCDARNAVFICTSNLGSDALLAAQGIADDQARRKAGRRGVFAAARQVTFLLLHLFSTRFSNFSNIFRFSFSDQSF